ncbi:MAG: hypothetical protein ABI670_12870 [Chloroflexota bacterium]
MNPNDSEQPDNNLLAAWRKIIGDDTRSWVLFEYGTCVLVSGSKGDLSQEATSLLAEWGPAHAGTPSGDFWVDELTDDLGWMVTCHHPDILNYISRDEEDPETGDMMIGLIGRARRDADAAELNIVHVEDRRTAIC